MLIRENLPDSKLIVACTRDSQLHTGMAAFQLIAAGLFNKVVTLADAKFMAACDVGPSWSALLSAPVIFGYDENDAPCFVKDGVAQPKTSPMPEVEVTLDACSPATVQ